MSSKFGFSPLDAGWNQIHHFSGALRLGSLASAVQQSWQVILAAFTC